MSVGFNAEPNQAPSSTLPSGSRFRKAKIVMTIVQNSAVVHKPMGDMMVRMCIMMCSLLTKDAVTRSHLELHDAVVMVEEAC